ncbi:MAG: DUF721 domain-containing protein [Patescibacteria group bacterium]|nr:DUF721 domain-containing protein [Patescibacteria group bacterium]
MKNISDYFSGDPRYNRYKKPLEAANICDTTRALAKGRFEVISYRAGLLTLSVSSPAQAANLNLESEKIINEINKKLGQNKIERLKFKLF